MKRYTMASALIPNVTKQPIKYIEIPLNKFSEEVIPHYQNVYENYKTTIHKLITTNNMEQLQREIKDKKITVKQLRDLMYELDTLRTQVEDTDLDKFDNKTLSLRKIILNLINAYAELEKTASKIILLHNNKLEEPDKENFDPFEGTSQIEIQDNLEDIKLRQQHVQLNRVENINKDVEDLHEMYKDLSKMVSTQAGDVDHIEQTVDAAQQNVENGAKDIMKAHRLKAVAYPVTGAFLGGIVGGPIGLVAGLKIGGIAALGFAIAGYAGGKYVKKMNNSENIESDAEMMTDETPPSTSLKKNI